MPRVPIEMCQVPISIRAHIVDSLPAHIDNYREYISKLEQDFNNESLLVKLSSLTQVTRSLMRIINLPRAEAFSVELEAVLTALLRGSISFSPQALKAVLQGCSCLCSELELYLHFQNSQEAEKTDSSQLLHLASQELHTIMGDELQSAYGGPAVAFPVQRLCSPDHFDKSPLQIRDFDLFRVEQEGLQIFLIEILWHELLKRGLSLGKLLSYLARTGHVFDARPCPISEHIEPELQLLDQLEDVNLRLLYGSPFAKDFVEALLRINEQQVHNVNIAHVRRYQPSWERSLKNKHTTITVQNKYTIEELLAKYDQAMTNLFKNSKPNCND